MKILRQLTFILARIGFCSWLLLAACSVHPATVVLSDASIPTADGKGAIAVYFTDREAALASQYEGGPDQYLAEAIDRARLSVDLAAYSLDLWSIRDALLRAQRRGVRVRMVMEHDNMDSAEVKDLQAAGIPVHGDSADGLMHDKFIILDRVEVWTGSMNYTVGGTYRDDNDLLCIHSLAAAAAYTREFEKMFTGHFFGPEKGLETVTQVTADGTPLEIYFSPRGGIADRLCALIRSAQRRIEFMAFSFTSNQIGGAFLERARVGVRIFGVMDDGQVRSNTGTEYDPLRQAGLEVRLDGNLHGLLHYKLIILDNDIVITGSYNFTNSAENVNDENLLVIFSPKLAARYLDEFRRRFSEAQP